MSNLHTQENNNADLSHFNIPVEAFNYNEAWGNYASAAFDIKWQNTGQGVHLNPHDVDGANRARIPNKLAATTLFHYEHERAMHWRRIIPRKLWPADIWSFQTGLIGTFGPAIQLLSSRDAMHDGSFQTNVPAEARIVAKAASKYMSLHHPVFAQIWPTNLVLI